MNETTVLLSESDMLGTTHNPYLAPTPRHTRMNHPDVQYFQRVKQQNHWQYHKRNGTRSIDKIKTTTTAAFNPYSVQDLIVRLKTFSALNWRTPHSVAQVSELKCAQNGWRCESFSQHSTKNHLICTCCSNQFVLKWDEPDYTRPSLQFWEAPCEEVPDLNQTLEQKYLTQITTTAHDINCSWRHFETPLTGFYYPRPYVNDLQLILDYLGHLKNLVDNHDILVIHQRSINDTFLKASLPPPFVANSNAWLAARCSDNKENLDRILGYIPGWFYRVAMYGWSLHIQRFSSQVVLLLICGKCNQRMFLNSTNAENVTNTTATQLPSCDVPMSAIEPDRFDPSTDHKPWCCNVNHVASSIEIKYGDFFTRMVANASSDMFDGHKRARRSSPPPTKVRKIM
ncbi:hypothetical protein DICA0_F20252 [Diutina catenulata]